MKYLKWFKYKINRYTVVDLSSDLRFSEFTCMLYGKQVVIR